MRVVGKEEKEKRGCLYCLDYKKVKNRTNRMCKHKECPYRELDDFETYEDYFGAQSSPFDDIFGAEE